jgi:hypothetical protein
MTFLYPQATRLGDLITSFPPTFLVPMASLTEQRTRDSTHGHVVHDTDAEARLARMGYKCVQIESLGDLVY